MSGELNYEAKTDRELLLLTAQKVDWLAANCAQYRADGECTAGGLSKKAKTSIWAAAIAAVSALVLGIIEALKR
ncbi:MAG: hypothetical protein WC657_07045 [Candidatus Paceibacterota bacterium]|jgi:hypothetical protein